MTTLVEHVNGHAPAAPVTPLAAPDPAPPLAEQPAAPVVMAIEGPLKKVVNAVSAAVGALGLLGFVNSFHRVDATAQPSFHGLAWTVPTGIDLGIFVFSALDIVLAILDMRIVWLRLVPWALTAVTIQLNIADQTGQLPLSGFDKLAHGVLPAMWALSVEVGAHVVRKRARLTSTTRMDRVRISRWLLAPLPTLGLWRRMVLWEEKSYPAALLREKTRVLARTDLADRYGRWWRFTAPRRERALYRLGDLVPATVADLMAAGPSTPETPAGPPTEERTVRADNPDRSATGPGPKRGPSGKTKRTGPQTKGRPSARRSRTANADQAADIADLIPLGEQVAAAITAADGRLTRAALVAEMRKRGMPVSNERAGVLLTHLRTATPADTAQTETTEQTEQQTGTEEVA
ncbi:DUF2637 domain-containing protein [Catenulispora subtropica]|uniref:DUF2637 domain-containing protein n=1 Tax=Catenulispora subtropica TaxID=450798 RepID=A0ABN2QLL1_9ACTN